MTIEKVRPVFSGRVIRVNVETVRLPNGHVADLEIIHHPGGAAAVAIDHDRRVCLIRQFRHAANGWIWELPAGKLEPDEPPLTTVQRELAEETGFRARHWRPLGPYLSSPGVFTETVHLFLAQELEPGRMAHEAAELIEVHWKDLEEACRWALDGTIRDGKTALGLLRARAVLDRGESAADSAGVCGPINSPTSSGSIYGTSHSFSDPSTFLMAASTARAAAASAMPPYVSYLVLAAQPIEAA